MINPSIVAAISTQIGLESFASASYSQLACAAYAQGLVATAQWLRRNAVEERSHADLFLQYLDARGVVASIPAVDAPSNVSDPSAMAAILLALEERVTSALQAIHDESVDDGQTQALLLDLLKEQTEGEDAARRFGRFVAMSSDGTTLDQAVRDGLLA